MAGRTIFHGSEQPANHIRIGGRILSHVYGDDLPAGTGIVINADGSIGIIDSHEAEATTKDCKPYKPTHPRDLSLSECAGDEKKGLMFYFPFFMPIDFEKLKTAGQFVESGRISLYHNHVLWSYAVRLTREEGDSFALSLVSCGSHLSKEPKTDPKKNDLPGLSAPPGASCRLAFFHSAEKKEEEFFFLNYVKPDSNGNFPYVERMDEHGECHQAVACISEEGLRLKAADGRLHFSAFIQPDSDSSYFSLASIIDLNMKGTVSATVEAILRGEKPAGCDWQITGGTDCDSCLQSATTPVYYVHKARFNGTSPAIEAALSGGDSGKTVELRDEGKTGCLRALNDHAVRLAIHIAYGGEVPMPDRDAYAKQVIDGLHDIFKGHFVDTVIPQWEREICRKALAFDPRDPSSSMAELLHLLNLIWSAPYGWMPVAKRIAIGVLADMAHFNARSSLEQWVQESVLTHIQESCAENENITSFLKSFYTMMRIVPHVDKWSKNAEGKVVRKEGETVDYSSEGDDDEEEKEEKGDAADDADDDDDEQSTENDNALKRMNLN